MKNRRHSTLKAAAVLFLFFALSLFSSCKVTIDGDTEYTVYGTVKGERNKELSKIAVYISRNGSSDEQITVTDSAGWFEFKELKRGSYTVIFLDINKEYESKTRDLSLSGDFDFETVTLSRVKAN